MNETNNAKDSKQNPYVRWANQTAVGAGLIIFLSSLVTSFLASMIAMVAGNYAEPAAGMFYVLAGCLYGPMLAFFLGLVWFVVFMIILRLFWKAPTSLVRLVIFGLSALVGIGISLVVFGIFIQF